MAYQLYLYNSMTVTLSSLAYHVVFHLPDSNIRSGGGNRNLELRILSHTPTGEKRLRALMRMSSGS